MMQVPWRSEPLWRAKLDDPEESEFVAFLRSIRLRTAYDEKTGLTDRIRERMRSLGLRADNDALRSGADQVRQWVIAKQVTRDPQ